RWKGGTMILRWCCAAMKEAQSRFRCIKAARSGTPVLFEALGQNDRILDGAVDGANEAGEQMLMALTEKGTHRYGNSQADIPEELRRYSEKNAHAVDHFVDAVCDCGGRLFLLALDDTEGAAVRTCAGCRVEHPIGDSAEYLEGASLEECGCPCGGDVFEITAGVSLYSGTDDVRWLYLGCRCPECGLTAVYGDWENEFEDSRYLL